MAARRILYAIKGAYLLLFGLLGVYSLFWLQETAPLQIGWDFDIYAQACGRAAAGRNPYAAFEVGRGFLNHPFLLAFVRPFTCSGGRWASFLVWGALSLAAWVLNVGLVLRIVGRPSAWWIWGLSLSFAPLLELLFVGQVNAFVALLTTLAFYFSEKRQAALAGVSLGVAAVLKTSPIVLLFYFFALRRWRAMGVAIGTLALLSGLSVVAFYPQILIDFAAVLRQTSQQLHISQFNQSWSPFLFRLGRFVGLEVSALAVRLIHQAILSFAFLALIAWGWRKKVEQTAAARLTFFALTLWLMVNLSPLVWYHHALFLLLPLALLLQNSDLRLRWGAAVALLLIQAERLFESQVYPLPLPILTAQVMIAGLLVWHYLERLIKVKD